MNLLSLIRLRLSLFSLLGDPLAEGCAWIVWDREGWEDGIREPRRRLVRYGTLSLKYPEVFFPRNCRSSSFLGSLNGPEYLGRIEKLPPRSLFLRLLLPFPFYLALVSFFPPFLLAKQFIRASASQTAAHYSTTIKLLPELRPSLHAHSRGFSRIYCTVRKSRIIRNVVS